MKRVFTRLGLLAAGCVVLGLAGCTAPAFPPTITPIYATTTTGLQVFNGTTWSASTTVNGLPTNNLTSLLVIGSGAGAEVIAGTASGGVSLWDGKTWGTWTTNDGLGSNAVNGLFLGPSLFAATASGLSTLAQDGSSPAWTTSLPGTPISAVYAQGSQTWVAADKLYVFNGSTQEAQSPFAPSAIVAGSTKVTAVFVDSVEDVFAGTDAGLGALSPGAGSFITLVAGTAVNGIVMDSGGTLYAATSSGLFILTSSTTTQSLSGTNVTCVCVDGAGTIYAGTNTGLRISRNAGASWTTQLQGDFITAVTTTAPLYLF